MMILDLLIRTNIMPFLKQNDESLQVISNVTVVRCSRYEDYHFMTADDQFVINVITLTKQPAKPFNDQITAIIQSMELAMWNRKRIMVIDAQFDSKGAFDFGTQSIIQMLSKYKGSIDRFVVSLNPTGV